MEDLSVKERIERAMNANDWAEFVEYTMDMHAADIAEALEAWPLDKIERFLESLEAELVADVLVEIDEDIRTKLLRSYSSEDIAHELVENMDSDDAADMLSELSEELTKEVLSQVEDVEQAKKIAQLLTHEEDTAGALMATELVVVNERLTAIRCVAAMRSQAAKIDRVHAVYVVNDDDILVGTLSLKMLLTAKRTVPISELYRPIEHTVLSTTPAEEVANVMQKYDLFVIPVVNAIGELLGRITLDDIVDFIRRSGARLPVGIGFIG